MSTPSPFETARAIGTNIGKARVESRDRSAIDEILQKASDSGNPTDVDDAMIQILRKVSPERQKTALSILRAKHQQIHDKKTEGQQARLQFDSVLKRYNSRIKEINESIKAVPYGKDTKTQVAALEKQKRSLQSERDKLLNFKALEDDEEQELEAEQPKVKAGKPKFDAKNKQHKAKAEQLHKSLKSREKVREALAEEFEF